MTDGFSVMPAEVLRLDVRGWEVDADDVVPGGSAWVELRHLDHATGQEARISVTPEGPRLRFRRSDPRVIVTVFLPPSSGVESADLTMGWHALERVVEGEEEAQVGTYGEAPAVIVGCAGCGHEARAQRARITAQVYDALVVWVARDRQGKPRTNLVAGHRAKMTREAVARRASTTST